MKNLPGNLLLLIISLAFILAIAEVISRFVAPISPGPIILDMQGNKQVISYIEPGKQFRISTSDYDAVTTITPDGYRAPQADGAPDTIFIGDSFTYAQGVKDNDAFPAIYCKQRQLNCANLAVPGASTLYEIDRLKQFLKTKNWKPQMVHFFFFTGNDFTDNLDAAAKRSLGQTYEPVELNNGTATEDNGLIKQTFGYGLKHSNLLRIAYYKVLPILRNNPEEDRKNLEKSLEIAQKEFNTLEKLSKEYQFDYQIYVIHPRLEITRNLYKELDDELQKIAPRPIIPLVDLFKVNTEKYFFPIDGHLSVAGNKKLAEFLLSR